MEIPIQVAVRISTKGLQEKEDSSGNLKKEESAGEATDAGICCVRTIPFTASLPGIPLPPGCMDPPDVVQVGPHSFPVTHALPLNCSQHQVYHQTVVPLMGMFMEGFDASVVAYGQKGCGKTFALYGNGFNETPLAEEDQGVVARCVREIFNHMAHHPERTYVVNITWVEICREMIRDVFGVGSVQCMNVTDAFHWLQVGYKLLNSTKSQMGHSLFSITLEQRWLAQDTGLIQHRLSTASFTDLGATERLFVLNALQQPTGLPKDLGLQSLERVVGTLIDPALMMQAHGNVPYNHTMLTTMLKDSFGGRAQTLVIVCVSPWERDIRETLCNLQFAFKVQCVHNYVVINSFSDDNTPATPEDCEDVAVGPPRHVPDNFGLQFAANQWSKLVANAEDLLSKLISSTAINELEKQQIEEWLLQKQECQDCLNSSESMQAETALGPIPEEADEHRDGDGDDDDSEAEDSDPESPLNQNSDNESDTESQRHDVEEQMLLSMGDFKNKTDDMVKRKYQEFMQNHPQGVMESQDSVRRKRDNKCEESKRSMVAEGSGGGGAVGGVVGRRRSVQPGSTLSSADISRLNRVALREQGDSGKSKDNQPLEKADETDDFFDISLDPIRPQSVPPTEAIRKKLRKLETDIEARLKQVKEIEETMHLKQNIITELIKNSDSRSTAKQRFHKKRAKLEAEYERSKKSLNKATIQQRDKAELERLQAACQQLEQRLKDVTSIKDIAGESVQKVKKLQQSLQESQKLRADLQRKVKKEKKIKEALLEELKTLKEREPSKALVPMEGHGKEPEAKDVQSRIAHLDHVLKEKSDNLEQYQDNEEREGLRHEIRNLRRTRDHLLDQRCSLDRKWKRDKTLSHKEERKLLECDEAIEAIDAAIEFKNELICGHKSIDTSERLQREKGEQMLMARLNKLSNEEMRTLLYKYFTKVIDLRDSSRKLELQLGQLERERDAWDWKERVLSNAVRQARLEGERKAVLLQRQHEMKLTLMMRHLAEETSNSSASFSDQSVQRFYKPNAMALAAPSTVMSSSYSDSEFEWPHQRNNPKLKDMELCPVPEATLTNYKPLAKIKDKPTVSIPTTLTSTCYSDSVFEWLHQQNNKFRKTSKTNDMELCTLPEGSLTKYKKPAVDGNKVKAKERETKNKLFAKFQVLTRYASNQQPDESTSSSNGSSKRKDKKSQQAVVNIQQESRKKLTTAGQKTKVTRQKNKLIIQDKSRKN